MSIVILKLCVIGTGTDWNVSLLKIHVSSGKQLENTELALCATVPVLVDIYYAYSRTICFAGFNRLFQGDCTPARFFLFAIQSGTNLI